MRLFLCSSTVTAAVDELTELVGGGARVAVVANALDSDEGLRAAWLDRELAGLAQAGLSPQELDLRHYYEGRGALGTALDGVDMVWATGGSVFVLIDAMSRSGLDRELTRRVGDDSLAYGGTSAGACICAPTLRGFELIEDDLPASGPSWDGLAFVPYSIVPHVGAAGAAGAAIDRLVTHLRANRVPHRTLRDGDAIVVRHGRTLDVTLGDR